MLDKTNWTILSELHANARVTFSELGRRVGLTPPAVADRVHRLEHRGLILGYRAELDLAGLGLPVEANVLLHVPNAETGRRFEAEVGRIVEVMRCDRVTGEDSYLLRVAARSLSHLELVLEELGGYGDAGTSIVLSTPMRFRGVDPLVMCGPTDR
jgi:Lrp/AsnC family leucine-responsive transcriptional regulator